MRLGIVWGFLACAALLAAPTVAVAQEYTLGSEDVVAISVYLHPELERSLAIDSDGNITLPPIGPLKAAGLTTKQLGDRISDRLATYLRQTTSVTVTVTQYLSRSVFVQGAVGKPGRYGFERMPGLIELIGQAGGATPGADLSRVEIVRKEGTSRRTLYANVAAALRDGIGVALPEIAVGDIVTVPAGMGMGLSTPGEGVGILGEVAKPGVYPVGSGQDLWSVLAIAGGLTQRGDLSKIRIISRDGDSQAVVTLNLKKVLERGAHQPQVVKPGDVIYVSPTGASKFATAFGGLQTMVSIAADVLNIAVLAQILNDQTSNP